MRIEAEIAAEQLEKAGHQQRRGAQQHEAHRDLRDHDRASKAMAPFGHRPGGRQHRPGSPGAQEANGRRQRHQQCRRHRDQRGKDQDTDIDVDLADARQALGQWQHHPQPRVGDHDSGDTAADAEQQIFDDQLAHDAPARATQREPHVELALAIGRARDQQVRDVGAGDEQHERDRAPEHQDARAHGTQQPIDRGSHVGVLGTLAFWSGNCRSSEPAMASISASPAG